MSLQDDALLLNEYAEWRTRVLEAGVDASTDAFMAQREAEASFRRVNEALNAFVLEDAERAYAQIEEPTEFEKRSIEVLHAIDRALVGDRPYVEERTLTGPTRRVFT